MHMKFVHRKAIPNPVPRRLLTNAAVQQVLRQCLVLCVLGFSTLVTALEIDPHLSLERLEKPKGDAALKNRTLTNIPAASLGVEGGTPTLVPEHNISMPDEVIIYSNQSSTKSQDLHSPNAEKADELDAINDAKRYGINVILLEETKTTASDSSPLKTDLAPAVASPLMTPKALQQPLIGVD